MMNGNGTLRPHQDSNRVSSLREKLLTVGIVVFAGAIRAPSLIQPLGPDQGIMSVIGIGILKGKLPYRDLWEMASPAIFYTYAAMFKLFGRSMSAIPITDILMSMLTTWLIYLVAARLWDRRAGWLSAGLFAVFANGARLGMHAGGDVAFGTFWYVAQRETFMLSLLTASILMALQSGRRERAFWRLFLAGFLGGLAFLFKFPSIFVFAAIVLYLNQEAFDHRKRKSIKALLIKNALLLSGFLLALAPAVVLFASKGALTEMTDVVFGYVTSVYGHARLDMLSLAKLALSRTIFLASEQFMLWVVGTASVLYIVCNHRSRENLFVVFWAGGAFLYLVSHMEFLGYHYLMILPPLCVLTGYGLNIIFAADRNLWGMMRDKPVKIIVLLAFIANLFVYVTLVHAHYTKFYFYLTKKITLDQYYDFFTAYPKHDYSFPADYKVSRYIRAHTGPGDKIYSLGGIESVIYFLTDRDSPSRFIYSWMLFSYAHSQAPQSEAYRSELLADLRKDAPALIVTVRPLLWFRAFPGLFDYVNERYQLVESFPDDRYVYARR
jgi:hypothetical protein